jgi:hypothetical protein
MWLAAHRLSAVLRGVLTSRPVADGPEIQILEPQVCHTAALRLPQLSKFTSTLRDLHNEEPGFYSTV